MITILIYIFFYLYFVTPFTYLFRILYVRQFKLKMNLITPLTLTVSL